MKFLRHHTQHSAKYLHVIIFLTVLLNSQSSLAIESRKIEKLIEDTQPPDKKAVLLQERQETLKEGRKYYYRLCSSSFGGDTDIFLVKTDFSGNITWTKTMSTGTDENIITN